jgi:subtilase family serine protease
VISQSFATTEETFASLRQLRPLRAAYLDARTHHVTVLASANDTGATGPERDGNLYSSRVTTWPTSDPLVTGVGATELRLRRGKFTSVAWNDTYDKAVNQYFAHDPGPNPIASNGGKSEFFTRPRYQNRVKSVTGPRRGVPDISMSGGCDGAIVAYGSFGGQPTGPGWALTCGASVATPEFAAIVALADQVAGHPLGLLNPRLYALAARHAPGIVDVTSGNDTVSFRQGGKLITVRGYSARKGYDLVSGLGTIDAPPFVHELAGR